MNQMDVGVLMAVTLCVLAVLFRFGRAPRGVVVQRVFVKRAQNSANERPLSRSA